MGPEPPGGGYGSLTQQNRGERFSSFFRLTPLPLWISEPPLDNYCAVPYLKDRCLLGKFSFSRNIITTLYYIKTTTKTEFKKR